jgi:hypothetical protein
MRSIIPFIIACVFAGVVPFFAAPPLVQDNSAFPGWPSSFEGKKITALPVTEREQRFAQDFPGKIARFSDGKREIIIRWVTRETRTLHPASDCFRGIGYTVTPGPLTRDEQSRNWSTFNARKGKESLQVKEIIIGNANKSWSDASGWYWSAVFQKSTGPWWAFTVAEREVVCK